MVFCGSAWSLVIFSGVSAGCRTKPAAASCPSFSGAPTLTQPAKIADAARAAKPMQTVLINASSFLARNRRQNVRGRKFLTKIAAPPRIKRIFGPAIPHVNRAAVSMRRNVRCLRRDVGQFRLSPAAAKRNDKVDRVGLDLSLGLQQRLFDGQLLGLGGDDGGKRLGAGL